ncbi:chitin synthase CHS3 KNAG_0K01570 [Huiozyma naganishii CBS 8797]|uniref:chitin synthase n=1 Tax=Huiozyma naganishii (strain ATCC MYA-139 / BCRC 22969 / CBS 8797 / KCTC 17520 / NBRC 10181 / NCYC 3082 / Yp74L-3) TaxID=1071383 RepID=J7RRP6_HUIN7|nr:hypothetical protein KNAG_0K01570 [Kazachstania naganishii CBS 8797]CCK72518.1 hypothetical protein KNAG_0K01570 [Kazachstania naganishii CBS 8797]
MNNDDYHLHLDEELLLRDRRGSLRSNLPRRQGSLVRPERNRLNNPKDPHYYYAKKTQEHADRLNVQTSATGVNPPFYGPSRNSLLSENMAYNNRFRESSSYPMQEMPNEDTGSSHSEDAAPSQNPFNDTPPIRHAAKPLEPSKGVSVWQIYCRVITFWIPGPVLTLFGMPKKERQMAWREKIAILSVIVYIGAIIAYLTFGFTKTVCGAPSLRLQSDDVSSGYVSANGKLYLFDGTGTEGSDLEADGVSKIRGPWTTAGKDVSFLFQNVNGNCHNVIVPRDNSSIPHDDNNNLAWYFPCKVRDIDGSTKPNFTASEHYDGWGCHTSESARKSFYSLKSEADVYFTWDSLANSSRNLVVYNDDVLDLDLLKWLDKDQLEYPPIFDDLLNSQLQGYDLSIVLSTAYERKIARCLSETIKVGGIDSRTVGCIASDVVLYVSLVFILSVVVAKFAVACYFRWVVSRKQGVGFLENDRMNDYLNAIEDWSENPNGPGTLHQSNSLASGNTTFNGVEENKTNRKANATRSNNFIDNSDLSVEFRNATTMSLQNAQKIADKESRANFTEHKNDSLYPSNSTIMDGLTESRDSIYHPPETLDPTIIHHDSVQQPPVEYKPFGYPLAHTICFVTCYSENEQSLRATLDSLAVTDYPNSHKLLMVVCDGLIKGSGNDKITPEIALDMMEDFTTPPEDVLPYSYVAVASGSKRHNMAKIYAGFYKFDDSTVPSDKQLRVPIVTIVKCGTAEEQGSAKPGNRGKRDSQIILMSFLQKITFDERMSELEFQLLKNIWQLTGLMADFYETVLMVDADTKVFPDSLKHMVAEMVKDPSIMGLCGETKIANKSQSWVTAIQVFEYFVSHHQAKAFESVFGSVSCLPGCFSIYRIKAPKGSDGYWVPILANPDIVERYSDNVTDSLHKKNLLLLGEDRYLSYLMLKTFPRRKQIFLPKAACKTIVPDTFKVLLSQRRRWINSTVHNLFELVLIRDLCGTFCFSMQFVIFIELMGTLVLPLAICFTIYVIIFAIVSTPTPIITLVLLAVILGLPGVLVVVTATKWSYLMWMAIYIAALPIWNFVLPTYAYWKFDDFSWGETRTIAGSNKKLEDDVEGEFDYSSIQMKTWREYENRDRLENNEFMGNSRDSPLFDS